MGYPGPGRSMSQDEQHGRRDAQARGGRRRRRHGAPPGRPRRTTSRTPGARWRRSTPTPPPGLPATRRPRPKARSHAARRPAPPHPRHDDDDGAARCPLPSTSRTSRTSTARARRRTSARSHAISSTRSAGSRSRARRWTERLHELEDEIEEADRHVHDGPDGDEIAGGHHQCRRTIPATGRSRHAAGRPRSRRTRPAASSRTACGQQLVLERLERGVDDRGVARVGHRRSRAAAGSRPCRRPRRRGGR